MRATLAAFRGRWVATLAISVAAALGVAVSGAAQGRAASTPLAVSKTVTSRVSSELVNINTTLGAQGGSAAGTGMVVTSSGEIVTNNHVIEGATKITATDEGNGRTYDATVVGYDDSRDIAVLQLSASSGLATVSFKTAKARVGQQVAALGNAGGKGGTPTVVRGTISSLSKTINAFDELDRSVNQLKNVIEFKAQLQGGQSGGALVDTAGRVVGMNAAASGNYSLGSGSARGYAIPIARVDSVAKQIVAGRGSATVHIGATAYLGVYVATNPRVSGATILAVLSGGPAEAAGLQRGDVITKIGTTPIGDPSELTHALTALHPGDRVAITWIDFYGSEHTATVSLATGPAG